MIKGIEYSVIIIHFGNPETTHRCIASLPRDFVYGKKIMIVDNSSNFNTENVNVKILQPRENLGFGGAVNFAVEYLINEGEKHFLVTNNDVVFGNKFFPEFNKGLSELKNIDEKIIVPRIHYLSDKNKIWYYGGYINYFKTEGEHYFINKSIDEISKKDLPRRIDFFSGAVFFFSKKIFRAVGKFDEKLFLYFEDLDYSLRVKQNKIPIVFLPQAIAYHEVSLNTANKNSGLLKFSKNVYFHRLKNHIIVIRKYGSGKYFFFSVFFLIMKIAKFVFGFTLLLKFDYLKTVLSAIKAGTKEKI